MQGLTDDIITVIERNITVFFSHQNKLKSNIRDVCKCL